MRSLRFSHLAVILLSVTLCVLAAVGCANRAGGQVKPLTGPTTPPTTSATSEPEYRAMWVTTAYNNDWPSKAALHRRVQKDEINAIVKRAKDLKCNLILLQVRGFGDRIYGKTSLAHDSKDERYKYRDEPWAQALNYDNDPGLHYDPFQVWLDVCNEQGIELHAWINPYRINKLVTVTERVDGEDVEHYLPVIKWNKQLYLDPTHIEVQKYVKAVIVDFLKHYPPEKNVKAVAMVPADAMMMLAAGDGPEGVIYDHQIPEEPGGKGGEGPPTSLPTTRSSTSHARLQLMTTVKTSAEKRLDYLKDKVYPTKPPLPENGDGKVADFLDWSYTTVTAADAKFGLSPLGDLDEDCYAKFQLDKDKVDYLIPELYSRDPVDFETNLKKWLDRAKPRVEVITGLNTSAVQTPSSDANEDVWLVTDIVTQMQTGRATSGPVTGHWTVGDAHFSAAGLRLEDQGGPEARKNVGKKLKEDKYRNAKLPPKDKRADNPGTNAGNPPGVPKPSDFTWNLNADGTGVVTWTKGPGRRPRRWEVWVWRGPIAGWGDVEILGEDKPQRQVGPDDKAIWVKGVDKFNRESVDFGKSDRP
jgi:uncharacterized lipoprotein YddW (UPF0748 family)